MNNEENNFEEFLREQLETHNVEVSDSVWAGIEKKQKKREPFVWFKHHLNVFIALDIVFISSLSAFTLFNLNEVQSQNKLQQTEQTEQKNREHLKLKNHPVDLALAEHTTAVDEKINRTSTQQTEQPALNHKLTVTHTKPVSEEVKNKSLKTVGRSSQNIKNYVQLPVEFTEENLPVEIDQQKWSAVNSIQIKAIPTADFNQIEFNQQTENPEFLPASVSFSKSKKVLNAELKANKLIEKENAEAALKNQEQQTSQKPTENGSEEKVTNTDQDALPDNSEDAPAKFDTVYSLKKFKGYFALDALVSPEISFHNLSATNQEAQDFISKRDSAEGLRLSYSALMRVNLFINRNLFVNTGISFTQQREKFTIEHKWITHEDYIDSTKFITHVDPFLGNTIYKTYDTLDYVRTNKANITHDVVLTFVDIPAMIGYKWLGRRTGLAVQGGVICNVLFKQKGSYAAYNYILNDVKTDTENPYNTSAGLSLAGAITGNFKLNDKLDLLVEPHTRYYLKSISSSTYPVQQKIFSYGLHVGLRLKL